ncbi:hypothetical protein AB0I98_42150 [Streptomyces sp. NPDC050211]|uniref:hypothetical protein n=1 Tax=Streptomyces sp. NPDC050211 TaxID=3154932 RepID=UPI0034495A2A
MDLLADRFPGSLLALETAGPGIIDTQDQHNALSKVDARMRWTCADPAEITSWHAGTQLLASHTLTSLPPKTHAELPTHYQEMLADLATQQLAQVEEYRLNLVRLP